MKRLLCSLLCLLLALPACALAQAGEPLFPACFGERWGYINARGETVLEPQWSYATDFRDGYALVQTAEDADAPHAGVIDRAGQYVVDPIYRMELGNDLMEYSDRKSGLVWLWNGTDRWGFFNVSNGYFSGMEYDTCNRQWAEDGNPIPCCKDGLYGAVDRTNGNVVIPYQFSEHDGILHSFHDGFGLLQTGESSGKLIRTDNTFYQPPAGTHMERSAFSGGLVAVTDDATGLLGFADASGSLTIPCEFSSVGGFSEGLANVCKDGLYGTIDATGAYVIEPRYAAPYDFHNGLAVVSDAMARSIVIDRTGTVVFTMEDLYVKAFQDNGLAAFSREPDDGRRIGFVDRTGRVRLSCDSGLEYPLDDSYAYAIDGSLDPQQELFAEGYQVMKRDNLYGFINEEGETVVDFVWGYATCFRDGLACVYDLNGKMTYIDTTGAIVWQET